MCAPLPPGEVALLSIPGDRAPAFRFDPHADPRHPGDIILGDRFGVDVGLEHIPDGGYDLLASAVYAAQAARIIAEGKVQP